MISWWICSCGVKHSGIQRVKRTPNLPTSASVHETAKARKVWGRDECDETLLQPERLDELHLLKSRRGKRWVKVAKKEDFSWRTCLSKLQRFKWNQWLCSWIDPPQTVSRPGWIYSSSRSFRSSHKHALTLKTALVRVSSTCLGSETSMILI